jgi:hypothetical protein
MVAIALIDDIIAPVVLSLLQALTTNDGSGVKAAAIAIPIVSALAWWFVGCGISLYVMPKLLTQLDHLEQRTVLVCRRFGQTSSNGTIRHDDDDTTVKNTGGTTDTTPTREQSQHHQERKLAHVVLLLVALLPGTYYSRSSHLLGAFLAGLSLCQQDGVRTAFDQEFGRVVEWLMRLVFGATIALFYPVPSLSRRPRGRTRCPALPRLVGQGRHWPAAHTRLVGRCCCCRVGSRRAEPW